MKFLLILLACTFIYQANATEVTITIKSPDKSGLHDITFGYGDLKLQGGFESMDSLTSSKSGAFEIDLEPGGYVFGFFHPAADHLFQYVFIGKESVTLDVTLGTENKPYKINSVGVYGSFNKQDASKAIPLKYDKVSSNWKLPKDKVPSDLDKYALILNGTYRTQDLNTKITDATAWGRYHNLYNGNEVSFTPHDLKSIKSSIEIKGTSSDFNNYFETYVELKRSFSNTQSKARSLIGQGKEYNQESVSDAFNELLKGLKELMELYPNYSGINKEIIGIHLLNHNPSSLEAYAASKKGDRTLSQQVISSEENLSFLKSGAKIIVSMDVNAHSITGEFIRTLDMLNYYFSSFDLYADSDIEFGAFDRISSNAMKSTNNRIRAKAIFQKAQTLSRSRQDKSKELLIQLQNEIPQSTEVRSGRVAMLMKKIAFGVGNIAPDFTLLSLDGEKVNLSDFMGKFVLLDFWGSWCAPCVQELPYLKKLDEDIADKSLKIIGIVCRESADKAQKAIDKFDLKYTNVIGTDAVQANYVINSYPSSFLVDPSGKIVAENLRGNTLSDMVRSYMKND